MLTIKLPPEMKEALKRTAERQFISISAATKQAIERYLQEQGIDQRRKKPESSFFNLEVFVMKKISLALTATLFIFFFFKSSKCTGKR